MIYTILVHGQHIKLQYLDEAVVEEEPYEGGAHAALGEEGPDHGGAHDEPQRGAAPRVERRRELPVRRRSEHEQGEHQAMPCPERSRHGQIYSS